jgi:hypothetical protein
VLGLTSKVVHKYLRYALVTFENFCTSPAAVMLSFVHYPESVYLIEHQFSLSHPLSF